MERLMLHDVCRPWPRLWPFHCRLTADLSKERQSKLKTTIHNLEKSRVP